MAERRISEELLRRVVDYLSQRPYLEVYMLISELLQVERIPVESVLKTAEENR